VSGARLFAHQFRSDLARFWRNPQSRYFTLLLPIVFLVIFAGIFKGTTIVEGQRINITTFYVPGIMTLGIISASFVIGSRAAVGVVVAIVMSTLLLLIGRVAYDVPLPHSTMPGLVIAVIVGAASFVCIAFAVSTRINTADAAAPTTNLAVLPLYFISGVFVPEGQIPKFLRDVASVFPIKHLAEVVREPIVHTHGAGISATNLLVVAAWGIAALLIAARTFQFSPHAA